jgi:hypothetical protein
VQSYRRAIPAEIFACFLTLAAYSYKLCVIRRRDGDSPYEKGLWVWSDRRRPQTRAPWVRVSLGEMN